MSFGSEISLEEWGDLDGAPELSGQEKQEALSALRETDSGDVCYLPSWMLEEDGDGEDGEEDGKNLLTFAEDDTVEGGSPHLVFGTVQDYSDKAWRVVQCQRPDSEERGDYVPKEWSVVIRRSDSLTSVESPQTGLDEFLEASDD